MCYNTTNGAGIDCVAEEMSSFKNRPFVAYYSSTQNYLFFNVFLSCGPKAKDMARSATPNRACYDKNGETPLQASLHAQQQQAIAAGGIVAVEGIRERAVKQRDESNARTAKQTWPSKLHWGDLTYPSSSERSPKLQRRPLKMIVTSRRRRFMHQRPRSVPRRPRCVLWTPSGGAPIGQLSPLQFCGPYSRLFAGRACSRLDVAPLCRK